MSVRTIASCCALRILPATDFHPWAPLQIADGEVSAGVGGAIAAGDEVITRRTHGVAKLASNVAAIRPKCLCYLAWRLGGDF
jgi:hypothetical protein